MQHPCNRSIQRSSHALRHENQDTPTNPIKKAINGFFLMSGTSEVVK
jgi:hypothetical protein